MGGFEVRRCGIAVSTAAGDEGRTVAVMQKLSNGNTDKKGPRRDVRGLSVQFKPISSWPYSSLCRTPGKLAEHFAPPQRCE
jgi:hypothetical protein